MMLAACDVPCYRIQITSSELSNLYVLSPCPCSCYLSPSLSIYAPGQSIGYCIYCIFIIFVCAKSR